MTRKIFLTLAAATLPFSPLHAATLIIQGELLPSTHRSHFTPPDEYDYIPGDIQDFVEGSITTPIAVTPDVDRVIYRFLLPTGTKATIQQQAATLFSSVTLRLSSNAKPFVSDANQATLTILGLEGTPTTSNLNLYSGDSLILAQINLTTSEAVSFTGFEIELSVTDAANASLTWGMSSLFDFTAYWGDITEVMPNPPELITFEAIPEPSHWVFIIGGLGLLLIHARRRYVKT